LGFAGTALAIDRAELDQKIRSLTDKFETLQLKADKSIPADTLREAKGIVLLDGTKAGFVFAYQAGEGLVMVKDEKTAKWGPAAFLSSSESSLGFQIGGQNSFVVMLFMNTNAVRSFIASDTQFGGEARGTAGNASGGAEGNIEPQEPSVLIYDDRKGLYGGAALKGGAIKPADTANSVYYGKPLTISEILFGNKVKPTDAEVKLGDVIDAQSKNTRK
jgi:lipid-binding SYLF domain-containing protein